MTKKYECKLGYIKKIHIGSLQAGINTSQLTLALESEAASIYCQHMHLIKTDGPPNGDDTFKKLVEKGKKYMVVDLGGWFFKSIIFYVHLSIVLFFRWSLIFIADNIFWHSYKITSIYKVPFKNCSTLYNQSTLQNMKQKINKNNYAQIHSVGVNEIQECTKA